MGQQAEGRPAIKSIRKLAPARVALIVLVGFAFVIGRLGRGAQEQQEAPLVDNGPNAGLSNGELVNRAVTNLRQLSSFHTDFSGPVVLEGNPGQQMTLLADVQLGPGGWSTGAGTPVPGSKLKMSVQAHTYDGQEWPASEGQVIWASDGKFYESTDSGQSWTETSADSFMMGVGYYISPWFWEEYWGPYETDGTPTAAASSSLAFRDGSPRLEKVDDVMTRHMVADVTGIAAGGPWSDPPAEIQLWISTEATPTVRKLAVKGTRGAPVAYNSLGAPSDVAFSPDGKTLAVAYSTDKLDAAYDSSSGRAPEYPGAIRLWDLTRPAAQAQTLPADGSLASISYSGDGKYLAAGRTNSGYASVWDLGSQKQVSTTLYSPEQASGVYQYGFGKVALRPDGKMVAAITDKGLLVWDLPVGTFKPEPTVLPVKQGRWTLTALAFSPDNQTLALGLPAGAICLYDLRTPSTPPRRFAQSTSTYDSWEQPLDMAFSPDGTRLAITNKESVRIWDLRPAAPTSTLVTTPEPDAAGAVAFGPDGRLLAVAAKAHMVQLWDTGRTVDAPTTPTLLLELDAQRAVTSLALSSDGTKLAATTEEGPVLLRALDGLLATGKGSVEPSAQVIAGSEANELVGGESYTLTWTWSRFNEDFGEVGPPPTETIR